MIKLFTVLRGQRWVALPALAASLVLATAGTATATTATAAAPQAVTLGHFEVAYAKSWTFKSENLGICANFKVTGNVTYTVSYTINDKFHFRDMWTSQKLNDPTLVTTIYAYNRGACNKSAKAFKVQMAQAYSGYSCSFNPALSFGIPWSVGISGWPSCGDRELARYSGDYTGNKSVYKQFDSGVNTGFGEYDSVFAIDTKPTPPCYGVYVTGTIYERSGSVSDSYGGSPAEVCLSKY